MIWRLGSYNAASWSGFRGERQAVHSVAGGRTMRQGKGGARTGSFRSTAAHAKEGPRCSGMYQILLFKIWYLLFVQG